ncbi:Zn(II)2Cys6 transcription factor protein [Rutstroemia sp. NJR-2017a BBW]|nr:Zn(II)2Cys6 transcription factor protein [Rutstroemia sp. NJR-2017a BBW]
MNEWSVQASEVLDLGDGRRAVGRAPKQAACLNCRRSKTRCVRESSDTTTCKRCRQNSAECLIPDYHLLALKPANLSCFSKRSGLDKAVHRIEQAIKTSKNKGISFTDDEQRLKILLSEAESLVTDDPRSSTPSTVERGDVRSSSETPLAPQNSYQQASSFHNFPLSGQVIGNELALDDAENPLQLLARASDLADSVSRAKAHDTINFHSRDFISSGAVSHTDGELRRFFGPYQPRLDIGSDIDPVDTGLVTLDEMRTLIEFHTRWGLDPLVHTADFIRSRSSFLLTSMLAASALFIPSAAALAKRLSNHRNYLAHHVIKKRYRSPEIVLGFMVNVPWMTLENHWTDDETCSYMAMAHSVALDLSLNKIIVSSPNIVPANISRSDCILAKKALDMDGFLDVQPLSNWGQRLLRRRERIWLALFNLDRGVCLARGRSFTVQISPLVEGCDTWHKSPISDIWDGSIVASSVLRRDLVSLIQRIKETCDSSKAGGAEGYVVARSLRQMIDEFFTSWYSTWKVEIGRDHELRLPPYVEILVSHARLSIYSSVLNHPTATPEISRFFRSGGLSSALNVMRAAVRGESLLQSMPNNTAIMVSFSACFALYLSLDNKTGLRKSIEVLIQETAGVLERIGNVTPHRKGNSALYGRHLKEIIRNAAVLQRTAAVLVPFTQDEGFDDRTRNAEELATSASAAEALQLSTMSDNQIDDLVDGSGENLGMSPVNFQFEDKTGMEWLDWFDFYGTA